MLKRHKKWRNNMPNNFKTYNGQKAFVGNFGLIEYEINTLTRKLLFHISLDITIDHFPFLFWNIL